MSGAVEPAAKTKKAPAKSRRGAKPFKPSARDRRLVETLAGYGVPLDEIRRIVVNRATGKPLSDKALLRHYGAEIARGLAKANAQVAESLYRLAVGQPKVVVDGKTLQEEREPKVTAAIFWAKTRMGWAEGRGDDGAGASGGPILAEAKVTFYIPDNGRDAAQDDDQIIEHEKAQGVQGYAEARSGEEDGRDDPPAEGTAGSLPGDAG